MRYLVVIFLLVCTQIANAQNFTAVIAELESLNDTADYLYEKRKEAFMKKNAEAVNLADLQSEISGFDSTALRRVKELIYDYGWLGISEVGEKANKALFLIIQNAEDPAQRELYFPYLEISVEMKESDPADMARMRDHMLIEQGESQMYGTHYKIVGGEIVRSPIDNPSGVNKRRRNVGLRKLR
jgi:hypothetical protein